jgi:hypothetical protein
MVRLTFRCSRHRLVAAQKYSSEEALWEIPQTDLEGRKDLLSPLNASIVPSSVHILLLNSSQSS